MWTPLLLSTLLAAADPATPPAPAANEASARASLEAAAEQARAAVDRVAALEQQVAALQDARTQDAARIAALESALAAEQANREQEARDRATSQQDLTAAVGGLAAASSALSTGSYAVGDDVAQAQALAADAAQRMAHGSPEEAALAAAAQRALTASGQALASGDLFRARVAVGEAQAELERARELGAMSAAGASPSR